MEKQTGASPLMGSGPKINHTLKLTRKLLLVFLCAFLAFNQLLIINIKTRLGIAGDLSREVNGIFYPEKSDAVIRSDIRLTGIIQDDARMIVLIKGVPDVYGNELNVSFDRVQESIDAMKKYDPHTNVLSKADDARYMNITGRISCEFCCTVKMLTNTDGSPACECDHAKAMRGLAAYLIRNHGNEYGDDEILRELARWKGVYFPREMIAKLMHEIETKSYSSDIKAILMGIQLPEYDPGTVNPQDIENVPDMVGGC